MNLPHNYDEWRLRGPDEPHQIGMEDGDDCGRYPEPDEGAPRGYRPKPCKGVMVHRQEGAEYYETSWVECDACGELA